ncbi:MAG: NAD(P)H-dependent oxidoreductase subunit E [Lachnotalea sp.]
MSSTHQTEQNFKELENFMNEIPDNSSSLISVLHKAQGIFGYLPKDVQIFVAKKLNQPIAQVNGVVTFYSYFSETPHGKYVINICMGTACFVKGSADILDEFERKLGIKVGETTPDNKFTLQVLRCIGACGLAPVVTVNDKVYGRFTKQMVITTLDKFME